MRFEAAPSEFDTNTEYDMYYTGVFNQSCVKTGGTPAMITLPHLYKTAGLPPSGRSMVFRPAMTLITTWLSSLTKSLAPVSRGINACKSTF